MKRVLILGSTGTIGLNTLKVIERFPDRFEVIGLSAYHNVDVLAQQARVFRPKYVSIQDEKRRDLGRLLKDCNVEICNASDDLKRLCSSDNVDIVVIGICGRPALEPFLAAVQSGKIVAPANKEALVIAGDILMREAAHSGAVIIPVDSEQSAIFQCLEGQKRSELKNVFLTASGGALKDIARDRFDDLTVNDILAHPRWKMGPKITVDSATMMNKGFEVIESQRLFGLEADQIDVLVHPEAVIHSMVGFCDGSVIAQLGVTDMQIPIQYALTYPQRRESALPDLDLTEIGQLNFEKPDYEKFPALALAFEAAREGGTLPAVLNAADEIAVEAFLTHQIAFTDIYKIVERVLRRHHRQASGDDLPALLDADQWARRKAREEVLKIKK